MLVRNITGTMKLLLFVIVLQQLFALSFQQCSDPSSTCKPSGSGSFFSSIGSDLGQVPSKIHSIWGSATSGINSPTTQAPSNVFGPKPTGADGKVSLANGEHNIRVGYLSVALIGYYLM
ncbi:hypothetical protein K7432_005606 [Basidiobolus ranarum]|uniref:Uncharacterized protein n=1 Tax=Basidiobolus ranarum TaxID=34480 RepID=A0ABR2WWF0_9FUNG